MASRATIPQPKLEPDRASPTRWVVAAVAIVLLLQAVDSSDIPFINDEPNLLARAFDANHRGVLAEKGLLGSFGVDYAPVCVWFYQLLLAITLDMLKLATLKIVVSSAALAFALWRIAELAKLSAWPLCLVAVSPFVAFYQRLLWDNVLLIPITAGMVAASASFLSKPRASSLWLLAALSALAFHVHILAVAPISACAITVLVFRFAWIRAHLVVAAIGLFGALGVSSKFIYQILFERSQATHIHPEFAHSLAGVGHGFFLWSHEGFELYMASFYRDSATLRAFQGASGWFAVAAGVAGLAAFVFWASKRSTPLREWPLDRQLALLATFMLVGESALLLGLRLEPFWHYFNGVWFGYFYWIWWGFDRVKSARWAQLLLAAQTLVVGVMTAMLAVHVHEHHGDRTVLYGPTLGNQVAVAASIVEHSPSSLALEVDNYLMFQHAPALLLQLEAQRVGAKQRPGGAKATVRYATASPDDGRVEVVYGDAPPTGQKPPTTPRK